MKILGCFLCLWLLTVPASALEIEAPAVPESARSRMPDATDSFSEGLEELLEKTVSALRPDLKEAGRVCMGAVAGVLMVALLKTVSPDGKSPAETAGSVGIGAMLMLSTDSLIHLASNTVMDTVSYGKLLLPVMTAAMAAEGGVTGSAALYAGSALFISLLQSAMGSLLVPGIYLYLALGIGSSATGEDLLKRLSEVIRDAIRWSLKILLMVFTGYLSLTGVVSGTTDAAAVKAARAAVSSFVPVVGGVLSDASEAVLVGVGMMKNAAGIYGILAVLALFLHPFLKIGLHYLLLKLTAAVCAVFGSDRVCHVVNTVTGAMGLLLGMVAAGCIMMLVSTVCFMKGVG